MLAAAIRQHLKKNARLIEAAKSRLKKATEAKKKARIKTITKELARLAKVRKSLTERLKKVESKSSKGKAAKGKAAEGKAAKGKAGEKAPKHISDPYYGVLPTAENAAKLIKHYTKALLKPFLGPAARTYYKARLVQSQRALRAGAPGHKSGEGLRSQAERVRAMADRARARRDYAASTRYTENANQLEQQARTADINLPQEDGAPKDEQYLAPKSGGGGGSEAPKSGSGEEGDVEKDSEESGEGSTPWYKSPIVWVGAVALAAVAVFARPKGKFKLAVRGLGKDEGRSRSRDEAA